MAKTTDDILAFGPTEIGNPPEGYEDVFVFVPAKNEIIQIMEGSGCNLDDEDIEDGYIDCIEYCQYDMGNSMLEVDGGTMLMKENIPDKYKRLADCIPDVLDMAYDESDMAYIILVSDSTY